MTEAPPPFVIFSLPRCRSFWCSAYLSYLSWHCGHEEMIHFRSLDDVRSWLAQPYVGTAETAAAPYWRLLRHYRPDARIVVLRRPIEEIIASFARAGWPDHVLAALPAKLTRLDHKLDQILQRWPGVLALSKAELDAETNCARLFQHCLVPYVHDHDWWAYLAPRNLQTSLTAMVRYLQAHQPQLERANRLAREAMLARLQRPRLLLAA